MNIQYKTPRQFCESISNIEAIPLHTYTRRPQFRFKPDECAWWLVPSTDNPHYNHGKFIFKFPDKTKKTISTGLHIEKGLDEQLKAVYSSKKASKFIMDAEWHWNKFADQLRNGLFFESLEPILNYLGKLKIIIDGGYVSEPTKFDPYQEKNLGKDKYVFVWDRNNKDILSIANTKRDAFVLKLHHVKSTKALANELLKLSEDAWLWLNLYITADFNICTDNVENDISLWENFFSPIHKTIS